MRKTEILVVAFVLWLVLMAMSGGCKLPPHAEAPVPKHPVPPTFAPEGHISTVGYAVGFAAVVAGVVLFFLIPEQHRLSFACIGGGGASITLAVVLKSSLWFLPYVAVAVTVIGFALLGYEIWKHYIKQPESWGA